MLSTRTFPVAPNWAVSFSGGFWLLYLTDKYIVAESWSITPSESRLKSGFKNFGKENDFIRACAGSTFIKVTFTVYSLQYKPFFEVQRYSKLV